MEKSSSYDWSQFEQHNQNNPEIYNKFIQFTLHAIRSGRKKYSAWTVMNRIRWETEIEENNAEFKINNNWIAFYARKFMQDFPQHKGFFEIRNMTHG